MAKKSHVSPMSKKVISSIFAKPATSKYPFVEPQLPENFRGQPVFDSNLCIGCGLCSLNCPAKAIEMVSVDGKRCPQFRLDKCIFCYLCVENCPRKAIKSSPFFELATTDKSSLIITPKPIVQKDEPQ